MTWTSLNVSLWLYIYTNILFFYFLQSRDFITIYDGMQSIYDGMQTIYNQTEKTPPRNIRSSNSNITIHFTSGDDGKYDEKEDKAFEITVEYILPGNGEI